MINLDMKHEMNKTICKNCHKENKKVNYVKFEENINAIKTDKFDEDAGYDLYVSEDTWVWPFKVSKVPLNIACELPNGTFGWCTGRSGMTSNGLVTLPGIVDNTYRGQIHALMFRIGLLPKKVKKGERVSQLIVLPFDKIDFNEVDKLTATSRGLNGFGHTGDK